MHVVLLQVVCRVFGVQTTVIVLFGDRRAHVLNCISHLGHQVWAGGAAACDVVIACARHPFVLGF